jgi:hypothetical protein
MLRNIQKVRCFLWRQNNPGKLLTQSDLRGGVFLDEASRHRKKKRDNLVGIWNVRSL